MFFTLLAGLVLVAVAAGLLARGLGFRRLQAVEHLRSIDLYGFATAAEAKTESPSGSGVTVVAERLGATMARRFGRMDIAKMRRDLLGAGYYGISAEAYIGYRAMVTASLTGLLILYVPAVGLHPALAVLLIGCGALLGWRIPALIVERRATDRYREIDNELPEVIDLLVVSVEAGVGLGGSLQKIASRLGGPLGDELRLMLQEQTMGLDSEHALIHMRERCNTPAVRSFVGSLLQGQKLGVSIGTILRNLAAEMRTRRRQAAEERAQKAPVKILFPLILLIFPAMFIVLLGPALFTLRTAFGGG